MDDPRVLTENEVMGGFQFSLFVSLRDAKHNGLVDNHELTGSEGLAGPEEQLLIRSESYRQIFLLLLTIYQVLALFLYRASLESNTTPANILLRSKRRRDRPMHLYYETCPSGFIPFFHRWTGVAKRIKSLHKSHVLELGYILCRKPPRTLPVTLPDPFPFFPTSEQATLAKIHGISTDLRTIALGIYMYKDFREQYSRNSQKWYNIPSDRLDANSLNFLALDNNTTDLADSITPEMNESTPLREIIATVVDRNMV
jgi:hypothetical protein